MAAAALHRGSNGVDNRYNDIVDSDDDEQVAMGGTKGPNSTLTPSNNLNVSDRQPKKKMIAASPRSKMESTFDGDATLDNLDVLMKNKVNQNKKSQNSNNLSIPQEKKAFDGNLSNYQPFENTYGNGARDANNSCTVMLDDDEMMKTKESNSSS